MASAALGAPHERVDVAVIGGGPGGAAAALALQRAAPHLHVRLYERATSLRPIGHIIAITANGHSCLQAIGDDVATKFDEEQYLPQTATAMYMYRELPKKDDPASENVEAEPVKQTLSSGWQAARFLVWWKVQQGLVSFLAPDTLQLGKCLKTLEDTEDGDVLLTFEDRAGTELGAEHRVQAKLVIGADGVQSNVRRYVFQDQHTPPQSLNAVAWRGTHPDEDAVGWPHRDEPLTHAYLLDPVLGVGITIRRAGDQKSLLWQVTAPWPVERMHEVCNVYVDSDESAASRVSKPADRLARCISTIESSTSKWPAFLLDMLKSSPLDTVVEHGLFFREADSCQVWGRGRVTLLGDAAHVSTPFLAQGAGLAMEDAITVAHCIARHGATEQALRQYESERLERVSKVQAGSVELGKQRWLQKQVPNEGAWHQANPFCLAWRAEPLPVSSTAV